MRRSSPQAFLFFAFVLVLPLFPAEEGGCSYFISEDGTLLLSYTLDDLSESKIRRSVEQGHRAEILLTFRVQLNTYGLFSVGGEHLEFDVRRTAYRDQITNDYVLLLNDREVSVYRTWRELYRAFSSPLDYSSGIDIKESDDLTVKVHPRIIYKKLVPPFSLMYLIPGKHMYNLPWESAIEGSHH
ncbi:MAG: hypothetical protein PQJ50_14150 [Spirochaetales bacterium]|nr:hypothetical protein [Spirochaetales bacterium]